MKQIFGCFLILFLSTGSFAAINMNTLEIGAGLRMEQETDGSSVDGQGTFSLGASIAFEPVDLLIEFSTFSDSEKVSQLSVSRRHYEWMSWLRYTFIDRTAYCFFVGAGLGFYWESITTNFFSSENDQSSGIEWLSGLGLGFDYKLSLDWALGVDARMVFNTNNGLSPVYDMAARLKYLF